MTKKGNATNWYIDYSGTTGSDFFGNLKLENQQQLLDILNLSVPEFFAEYTLYRDDWLYPYLHLVRAGEYWYVHYFPSQQEPGYFALDEVVKSRGTTFFPTATYFKMDNRNLVTTEVALQVAREFYETGEKPSCCDWFEL
ncbi:MAG: hypothetical protein LBR25_03590 [Erysipelotrichaceae bacterium]|jgi:hypothetical protein|nr:hypothetical protein [Erysipelotrichaceae bacterium]